MRSLREIRFRLRQEAANLILFAAGSSVRGASRIQVKGLPAPPDRDDSPFQAGLLATADQILSRRVPLLGLNFDLPSPTPWRKDLLSGIETAPEYFRKVPYLDPTRAGDHKVIWELNRHQHLALLAQAWSLTHDARYTAMLSDELESWFEANPFQRGINWASALEVAFRAWSWIWILHLAGSAIATSLREKLVTGLHQHGLHLEYNLSYYFSPNTHLLGEAAILHAIGRLLPDLPRAARWERIGDSVVSAEIDNQIQADGSHFEQSSYYHVYAVDFFLLHRIISRSHSPEYENKLIKSVEYLDTLLGPQRRIPLMGDDDGGRLFYPFGTARDEFGRATMATAAVVFNRPDWLGDKADLYPQAVWWTGRSALEFESSPRAPWKPEHHEASGTVSIVSRDGQTQVFFDAGHFGRGSAGHSHSDTLSIVVRSGLEELLTDAATYTYVGDARWRDWFRGSAAHNTVRINGLDQATGSGPFRWLNPPRVEVVASELDNERGPVWMDVRCEYSGFEHRRRLWFRDPGQLCIVDEVRGPEGEHVIEHFWHCGVPCSALSPTSWRIGARSVLTVTPGRIGSLTTGGEHGWRSRALGQKEEAPVIRTQTTVALPAVFAAVLDIGTAAAQTPQLTAEVIENKDISVTHSGGSGSFRLRFTETGVQQWTSYPSVSGHLT